MKVKYIEPYDKIRGKLSPNYYARTLNGIRVAQHCPRTSSEKQREMRKRFAEKYAGQHRTCP